MTSLKRPGEGPRRRLEEHPVRASWNESLGQGPLPAGYRRVLDELKSRIRTARVKATLSANRELIELYWHIGKVIVERQRVAGWGKSVVRRLARDIGLEFPDCTGFSAQNIWFMRSFFLAWTGDFAKLLQPVRVLARGGRKGPLPGGNGPPEIILALPWGHNIHLMTKVPDPAQRLWYAQKAAEHGWSRAVLDHQIELGLFERQGKAVTNFSKTLPQPQSDLALQVMKDPYVFDIKAVNERLKERELEKCMVEDIQKLLLELGVGFAFVGSQYHIEVEGEDFYIDMLFYHLRLRCFVVIDLKTGPFRPEYAGKMNFYLSAVDDMLKNEHDNPTIGIILCKTKKKLIAEYALRKMEAPIGVSGFRFTRRMPEGLKENLPGVEALERGLKRKQL